MLPLRMLPFRVAAGAEQMACDEALLESAANSSIPTLRFYQWSEPTLSLGYFQPAESRKSDPRLRLMSWVRRSSGGAAIAHDTTHELTYSFTMPAEVGWPGNRGNAICEFHYLIRDVLLEFNLRTHVVVCGEEKKLGEILCFLHHTPGDVVLNGSKVVGSAQRKLRGAYLQHGTILLSTSPYTPQLPGLGDATGHAIPLEEFQNRLTTRFAASLQREVLHGDLTAEERLHSASLANDKYNRAEWNERR